MGKNIDETNFKEYAQLTIKKYEEMGMVADAMLWSYIIRLYESELEKLEEKVKKK